MSMNPGLMDMVVAERVAELQKVAKRSNSVRTLKADSSLVTLSVKTATVLPGAARRSLGWFLVSVGTRLVISERRPMSAA